MCVGLSGHIEIIQLSFISLQVFCSGVTSWRLECIFAVLKAVFMVILIIYSVIPPDV